MKLIDDCTPCLLHLLLLAGLCVPSSSYPASRSPLCGMLRSMIHQVERLTKLSGKFHNLTGEELEHLEVAGNRLAGLPDMEHTAAHIDSLKVNESLSQLFMYTQSFRLHVNWLKTAKENVSLSSHPAKETNTHLLHLSTFLNASLHQIGEEVPPSQSPSLPEVSTAFDVLQFSVEISKRLRMFCFWSKRVLLIIQGQSPCPRH
ncbi:hypothetical protein CesoFtcFv8_019645 [Champsocephalus esox]|uniref:Interleukin-11 n=1 Tax=Champsocephalus esox TaxID=159716 RepID=A0AAN8BEH3_9TELE|nr:hypothetical protein CesoFtcFv8_019645 [Champsocephalus esox]